MTSGFNEDAAQAQNRGAPGGDDIADNDSGSLHLGLDEAVFKVIFALNDELDARDAERRADALRIVGHVGNTDEGHSRREFFGFHDRLEHVVPADSNLDHRNGERLPDAQGRTAPADNHVGTPLDQFLRRFDSLVQVAVPLQDDCIILWGCGLDDIGQFRIGSDDADDRFHHGTHLPGPVSYWERESDGSRVRATRARTLAGGIPTSARYFAMVRRVI